MRGAVAGRKPRPCDFGPVQSGPVRVQAFDRLSDQVRSVSTVAARVARPVGEAQVDGQVPARSQGGPDDAPLDPTAQGTGGRTGRAGPSCTSILVTAK